MTADPLPITKASSRFGALDGLRGVSAIYIIGIHVTSLAIFSGARLAVDFFFILSGFVLAPAFVRAHQQTPLARKFVRARIFRLLPLQIVVTLTLAGMLVIESLYRHAKHTGGPSSVFRGKFALAHLPEHLTMLQSVVGPGNTWVEPSWTVSTEFLINVILITALLLIAPRFALPVLLVTALVGAWLTVRGPADDIHGWPSIWRGLLDITLGVITRQIWLKYHETISRKLAGVRATIVETVVLVLAVVVFANRPGLEHLAKLPALALWVVGVLVFAHQGGFWSKVLTSAPILALGTWSYGIYLWHVVVAFPLNELPWKFNNWVFLLMVIAGTLIVASFTYRTIEAPMQEWGRHAGRKQVAK